MLTSRLKIKECRDKLEPYSRAASRLDRLYSAVFDGGKFGTCHLDRNGALSQCCDPEAPELEFFEWEIKCAKEDYEAIQAKLENEMAGLKLLNTAHATHAQVLRQFATIERLAVDLRRSDTFSECYHSNSESSTMGRAGGE